MLDFVTNRQTMLKRRDDRAHELLVELATPCIDIDQLKSNDMKSMINNNNQ
jgi:hypothetical protein